MKGKLSLKKLIVFDISLKTNFLVDVVGFYKALSYNVFNTSGNQRSF